MSHLMRAWSFAKGVPSLVGLALTVFGVAVGAWQWHGGAVSDAYAKGRTDVLDQARVDSALIAMTIDARAKAMARTDTVRDTVRVRVERVREVAVRVPDSVRVAYPVVDTLVVESARLVAAVDSLTQAIDMERATNAMALAVITAQLTESRLVNIRQADSLRAEVARPKRTIKGTVISAAIGAGLAEAARLGITILLRR